ncbi:MAG TPA: hypothetical protein VFV38_48655 [Ktedonobacteraceae bacterium]|nr:hypothetical protein [Ktedonobacteraceae bacterium]
MQFRRNPQPQSKGWFLHHQGEQLFSFDFPERLFRLCADQDALTWTTNSQGETSRRLQTTVVNLRDSLGGDFDNQVHQIELEMTREAFEHMRSQLNKSPKSR